MKTCIKSPFQKDSKEYEELSELVNAPPVEKKKKFFTGINTNYYHPYTTIQ